ncbi:putative sugar kinase YdjH [bioreactor metagenome]|uniref:Putative sugar kinase YdjH n=1 Tax=bioreactor metagenome TaxID=1076179 RepID=A0A645I3F8_9ZZZZ
MPAYQVPVIDTCGAGDSFVAGFLAGLAYGWDMRDTCQFANALAANSVQYLGATTGRLDLAGVRRFMAETPIRPLP